MPDIYFDGSDLLRGLEQVSQKLGRRLMLEAVRAAAEPMRVEMGHLAPRSAAATAAGHLATRMVISGKRGADIQEAAVAVGPAKKSFYGIFQEFGTRHQQAYPFARPAFDLWYHRSLRIMAATLGSALTGRGKGRGTARTSASTGGGLL